MVMNLTAERQQTALQMMPGLQSTIWQQFKEALIQKLNPVSLDVHVITNGFDH